MRLGWDRWRDQSGGTRCGERRTNACIQWRIESHVCPHSETTLSWGPPYWSFHFTYLNYRQACWYTHLPTTRSSISDGELRIFVQISIVNRVLRLLKIDVMVETKAANIAASISPFNPNRGMWVKIKKMFSIYQQSYSL